MLTLSVGCQDYHWRWDYEVAEREAREQGKFLFIFYKGPWDNASNRMHGDVLADNEVGSLFQDTINLFLQEVSEEHGTYVKKYGVTRPPACVLVGPDGVPKVRTGYVPKQNFIKFAQQAMSVGADKKARPEGHRPTAPAE